MGKKKNKMTITGLGTDTAAKYLVYRKTAGQFEMYKGVDPSRITPPEGLEDTYKKLLSVGDKFGAKISRAANKHPEDKLIYKIWDMSECARERLYKLGYRVWLHAIVDDPHEDTALWNTLVKLLTGGNLDKYPSIELLEDPLTRAAIRGELTHHNVDCVDGVDFENLLENVLMRTQEQWFRTIVSARRDRYSGDTKDIIDHIGSVYKTLSSVTDWSAFQNMCGVRKVFDPCECLYLDLQATRSLGFTPANGYVVIDG